MNQPQIQAAFKTVIENFLATSKDHYKKLGVSKQWAEAVGRAKCGVRIDTAEKLLDAAGYELVIRKKSDVPTGSNVCGQATPLQRSDINTAKAIVIPCKAVKATTKNRGRSVRNAHS